MPGRDAVTRSEPEFQFSPARFVPFRNAAEVVRLGSIKTEDIAKRPNPDFRISVIPDDDFEFRWVADMFHRIKTAADAGRPVVLITPNPCPVYKKVAHLVNRFGVDCSRVHTFNMDEYANEHGDIAPSWPWRATSRGLSRWHRSWRSGPHASSTEGELNKT